jgi:hypothetical protein
VSVDLRKQAIPVLTLVSALIGVGVVLQLWLLGASLEAYLAGDGAPSLPATIASVVLFLVNVRLLAHVLRVDRRVRHAAQGGAVPGDSSHS